MRKFLIISALVLSSITVPAYASGGNQIVNFSGLGQPVTVNGFHYPDVVMTPGSAAVGGIVAGNINFVTGQLFGTSAVGTITFIPAGYWGPSAASQPLCFFFPRSDANFNGYVSIWNEQTRSSAYAAGSYSQDASGNWEVILTLIAYDGFYSMNQVSFSVPLRVRLRQRYRPLLLPATKRLTENELSDFSQLWHDGCGETIIGAQHVDRNHSTEV